MHKVLWPRGQYLHFSDHSLYLLWLTFYHLHKLSLSLCHTKYDKYLSQIWNEERKKLGKIIWDNRITRKQHWYKEYCTFFIFLFSCPLPKSRFGECHKVFLRCPRSVPNIKWLITMPLTHHVECWIHACGVSLECRRPQSVWPG